MKKTVFQKVALCLAIIFTLSFTLTGCNWPWEDKDSSLSGEPTYWTIQYTDDDGTHQLKVEEGMPFYIEKIPHREGYDFLGLFDAEVGGTQYVAANGSSLSVFTDRRNMVLFPQYRAKKFTLQLNYGNAPDAGIETVEVSYNEEIRGLPDNFFWEGGKFIGWYNTQDTTGTKFTDGMVMNKTLADLADENNHIALYAVFETTQYTVRFYSYDENTLLTEKQVAHGTILSEVAPKTLADGSEISAWSTLRGHYEVNYDEEIISDGEYYVSEYYCILTWDYGYNGEIEVERVKPQSRCNLKKASRNRYTFLGWYNGSSKVDNPYMPEKSTTLTAKWSPNFYTITFNSNGGSSVSAREVDFGQSIDLPKPTKAGCIFTYWKTSSGTKVTSPYRPTGNITLYAVWVSDITASLSRVGCQNDQNYNPNSNNGKWDKEWDAETHVGFEVVQAILGGVAVTSDDTYFVPQGSSLSLSLQVLQDIGELPKLGDLNLWSWNGNQINDDTCTSVYGTGISEKVGKGAYSVVITYGDGTKSEITATNFMDGMSKNETKSIPLNLNSAKRVASIKITVVYEIKAACYKWGWWDSYTNWRCEKTFDFA